LDAFAFAFAFARNRGVLHLAENEAPNPADALVRRWTWSDH
jgi:hypothetical protein